MPDWLKHALIGLERAVYQLSLAALMPINVLLARMLAGRVTRGSVLHVAAMVHVPFYTVGILREHGVNADYLAVGDSPWWNRSDYHYRPRRAALGAVFQEMWWVWHVVSRYEIVHAHFMMTVTRTGWEWALLRRMGRQIVVHYRGCEIRNRELNMRLHPAINICQECDYTPRPCEAPINVHRRRLAAEHGSAFLATTPDMKDFAPSAQHVPFLVTRPDWPAAEPQSGKPFKIVHATNHPGIEGSRHIRAAVDEVRAKGHAIDYVELMGVTHQRVLDELRTADLSIGKMKMGYYANLQIESMAAGVPTITYVRPELMTEELRNSGFIFASLPTLASTLEHVLTHPEELAERRAVARRNILALHDNHVTAEQYKAVYARITSTGATS